MCCEYYYCSSQLAATCKAHAKNDGNDGRQCPLQTGFIRQLRSNNNDHYRPHVMVISQRVLYLISIVSFDCLCADWCSSRLSIVIRKLLKMSQLSNASHIFVCSLTSGNIC